MEEKNSSEKEKLSAPNSYIKYSSLGFQMIAIIGMFTFAGYKIDEYNQSKNPIFTALLSLFGVIIALYTIFRALK
ncbi:MAG: AtpZ/AtpI family protein [Pelobium sp.]